MPLQSRLPLNLGEGAPTVASSQYDVASSQSGMSGSSPQRPEPPAWPCPEPPRFAVGVWGTNSAAVGRAIQEPTALDRSDVASIGPVDFVASDTPDRLPGAAVNRIT